MTDRRDRNRRAILNAAQSNGPLTRGDLARSTGLSSATVSGVVADLLGSGVLVELETRRPAVGAGGGRPACALSVNPELGTLIGIHLAHAHVRIVVAGLGGGVLAEHTHEIDVDHQPADSLEYVASTALDLVADLDIAHRQLLGVGVAVSSPVLLESPTVSSPMLSDWGEVDIPARLGKRMGLDVHVGNDANLAALAEWRLGAGRGADNLIYVMLSEGVGAGLVLDGKLYEGETGAAGELGHVTVVADGQICRCGGRGCLETVVGARALTTTLAHSHGPGLGFADLIALAERGDPGVWRLVNDAGRAVGVALAGACAVLDPKLIVVGGTLAQTGQPLLGGLRESLARSLSPVSKRVPEVVSGTLGVRAEVLGAVTIAGRVADLKR